MHVAFLLYSRDLVSRRLQGVYITVLVSLTVFMYTYLLYSGDLVSRRLQGSPQGRVPGPRLLLQDLLLNGVQVFHHVPGETLLGTDEHLDHLERRASTVYCIRLGWCVLSLVLCNILVVCWYNISTV